MSSHNIGFNQEMAKIIFQLSSNTHRICPYELPSNDHFMCSSVHVFIISNELAL